MSRPKKACVVGSGLAGLATATLLVARGYDVTLVEAAPVAGGLLRKREIPGLGTFDCGTHLIEETGHPELDELLFNDMSEESGWNAYGYIPNDSYFAGSLSKTGFVDTRGLDPEVYAQGLNELLNLPETTNDFMPQNLEDAVTSTFGETFRDHLYRPVFDKLFNQPLEALIPLAHHLFGLKRLVCESPEKAEALKAENRWNDDRLAFHHPSRSPRPIRHFYPKSGGIGRWVDQVVDDLKSRGVTFHFETQVTGLTIKNEQVSDVELSTGERLPTDLLAWTVPSIGLLKAASVPLPSGLRRPSFASTILIDLIVDSPPQTDAFYVTCYDPSYQTFRITLYDNLEGSQNETPHRLTIEVLRPPGATLEEPSAEDLLQEAVSMEVLPQGTRILKSATELLPSSYPILTTEFASDQASISHAAAQIADNLALLGQAGGKHFFKSDILTDIHQQFSAQALQ